MNVLFILRSEMFPTSTASKTTLLCTRPISKEATFPSTGLSCKTGRLAGNQPRRKWLLVMEQSRETLSCTFWSKEGKCWNVDMKIITGNYFGFDCCVQICIWLDLNGFPSRVPNSTALQYKFSPLFWNYVIRSGEHNSYIQKQCTRQFRVTSEVCTFLHSSNSLKFPNFVIITFQQHRITKLQSWIKVHLWTFLWNYSDRLRS